MSKIWNPEKDWTFDTKESFLGQGDFGPRIQNARADFASASRTLFIFFIFSYLFLFVLSSILSKYKDCPTASRYRLLLVFF